MLMNPAFPPKHVKTLFYLAFSSFFLGIAIHQILIGLFFLAYLIHSIPKGLPLARTRSCGMPAVLFLGGILLSALWTSFAYYPFSKEISFHWAFLVFWLFDRDFLEDIDWEKFLMIFAAMAIPGLIRSFYWLMRPSEIIWAMDAGFNHFPRAFGFNANPITYSEGLLILSCLFLARLSFKPEPKFKRQIIYYLVAILVVISLSRVRSGWLAFGVICVIHAMIEKKHRTFVFILLTMLVLGFLGAFLVFGFNSASIQERVELFVRGVHLFTEHPVLGIGPERFSEYPPISNGLTSHPHNTIAGISAEMGLVGLTLFLVFFLGLFHRSVVLFKAYRGTQHAYAWVSQALLYALISFTVFGITDYNFGSTEVLLLHGMLWAILSRIPLPEKSSSSPEAPA